MEAGNFEALIPIAGGIAAILFICTIKLHAILTLSKLPTR